MSFEDLTHRFADESLTDFDRAFLLTLKDKLNFARHSRQGVRQVANTRNDALVSCNNGPPLCVADQVFNR